MTNASIAVDQEIVGVDADDIYEPPPSPPPVHAIYLPESYHYAGTLQDNSHHYPVKKNSMAFILRKSIYNLTKKTLILLLRNNNILLIGNLLRNLWKQRIFVYRGTHIVAHFIQQNGYQQSLLYIMRFLRYQITTYLVRKRLVPPKTVNKSLTTVTRHSLKNPIKSFFVAVSVMKHIPVLIVKLISKAMKSVGGLDSILLAFSVIALTKSIQHSNSIF